MASIDQGPRYRLAESFAQGVTTLKANCWLRLQSHLGLRVLFTAHVVLSRIQGLAAEWLISLCSCCCLRTALSSWGHSQGLAVFYIFWIVVFAFVSSIHRLNGHEFVWTPGVGDGQGGLACCSSWGCKESDTTECLNRTVCLKEYYHWLNGHEFVWTPGVGDG